MKITGTIPDHILRRMSPEDRAPIGKSGITAEEAAAKFELKNERDLQKLIRNELLRRGIPHSWNRTDKKTTNTIGFPDFAFPLRGKFCFIEVKFGKGDLRLEQVAIIESLKFNGAIGIVARDFQSVNAFLDERSLAE